MYLTTARRISSFQNHSKLNCTGEKKKMVQNCEEIGGQEESQTIAVTRKKKKLLSWGNILVALHSWRLQDSKNACH